MQVENNYYKEYLLHKCLYYKHGFPVLSDQEFDKFEKEYMSLYPSHKICFEMCDWCSWVTSTSRLVDRMGISKAKEEALRLVNKRKNNTKKISVDIK